MSSRAITKIRNWCELAKRCPNAFIKFFAYYMCLDSFMTTLSKSDLDSEKKKWFLEESGINNIWDNNERLKTLASELSESKIVYDERPQHAGPPSKLKPGETNSLKAVYNFIFQIRCNLFHGAKCPQDNHDSELVARSWPILEIWVNYLLSNIPNNKHN